MFNKHGWLRSEIYDPPKSPLIRGTLKVFFPLVKLVITNILPSPFLECPLGYTLSLGERAFLALLLPREKELEDEGPDLRHKRFRKCW